MIHPVRKGKAGLNGNRPFPAFGTFFAVDILVYLL